LLRLLLATGLLTFRPAGALFAAAALAAATRLLL
jgi:hypothetical protein